MTPVAGLSTSPAGSALGGTLNVYGLTPPDACTVAEICHSDLGDRQTKRW